MSENIISGILYLGSGIGYDNIISDTSGINTVFNRNGKNIDFAVSGTNSFLYYDASTGRLGLGDKNPDAALHIIAPCAYDGLKIEGTTNCPTGVRLLLLHNPGISPESGSYPATIDLAGHDGNSQTINYAQIRSRVLDPTTSATSGEIIFNVDHTGTLSTVFRSNTANTVLGGLNTINGYAYNVFGANNVLSGLLYIDLGSNNTGTISSGLLLGNDIDINGSNAICISNTAGLSGINILLVGNNTFVSGYTNVVVANNSVVSGSDNILLGNNNTLSINTNKIIGLFNNANIGGSSGVGMGSDVKATGINNVFIGNNVTITGANNSAIGTNTSISGDNNLVYGGSSSISGFNIVSIGNSINPVGVSSGLFIGNDIDVSDSSRSVVMGLGNAINNILNNSTIIGLTNDTSSGEAHDLVMVGQNNKSSTITNTLVMGNYNDISGIVSNNIVLGPNNFSALTSSNNIIIGALNNNSGMIVTSDGNISGSPARSSSTITNSLMLGINNIGYSAVNASVVGNKNYFEGNNFNSIGSFNNIKNTNHTQNIGNNNFILGNYTNILGGRVTSIGSSSIINNPSKRSVYSFGDGNILFGNNEIVVSGLCIGDNNDLLGLNNIVYGKNNYIGRSRNPCIVESSVLSINGDVTVNYKNGDRILVSILNPAATNNIYTRLVDQVEYDNVDGITRITISEGIAPVGVDYGIQSTFDGASPATSVIVSGWAMPHQDGNDLTDPIGDPLYGDSNIVIGAGNRYPNTSGLILGRSNSVTGVNNIIIGYGITNYANNSVQIGSNNANKIYFDDDTIILNTGLSQSTVILNSRLAGTTLLANLAQNRVGINTSSPRSTLDVSGTLTTNTLRVGLSAIPGYALISDASGNATWQFPVNLSGINNGILYRINNKVASGINELVFNPISKFLTYLKPSATNIGDLEDAFILTPSGLFINDTSDDNSTYDITIKGSGVGLVEGVDGYDIRVNLLKTLPKYNAIQVYNITGVSGHFYRHSVTDKIFLPLNLTGTLLNISSTDGELQVKNMPGNTVLFANRNSLASGNNDIKFFSNDKILTIGSTGVLSDTQTLNFAGSSDVSSNIILGSTPSFGTVINNAGYNQPFSIIDAGRSSMLDRKGLHYSTTNGILGLSLQPAQPLQFGAGSSTTTWSNNTDNKLVVAGRIYTQGLQIVLNGNTFPPIGQRYLRVNDDGVVSFSALDISPQFSGIFPIYAQPRTQGSANIDIGILNRRPNSSINLSAGDNGLGIVWDGNKWNTDLKGIRFYQPDSGSTNDDLIPGLLIGPGGRKNSCNNTHVFAGTPFMSADIDSRYVGSNQLSRFYLKGRTINNSDTELVSDFSKDVVSSITATNTISTRYLYNPSSPNLIEWNGKSVWLYKAQFCGLAYPVNITENENNPRAVAGTLEGACILYRSSDNTRIITALGSPNITIYKSSQLDWGSEDPVYVTGVTDGNIQRLAVKTRGLPNYNILWNTTVDIQQLNHPSGINISAQF